MFQVDDLVVDIVDLPDGCIGRTDHVKVVFFPDPFYESSEIIHALAQKFLIFSRSKDRQHMCRRRIIHQKTVAHLLAVKSFIILGCRGLDTVMFRMVCLDHCLSRLIAPSRPSNCLSQKLKCPLCTAIIGRIQRKVSRHCTNQSHIRKVVSLDDHLGSHQDIRFMGGKR